MSNLTKHPELDMNPPLRKFRRPGGEVVELPGGATDVKKYLRRGFIPLDRDGNDLDFDEDDLGRPFYRLRSTQFEDALAGMAVRSHLRETNTEYRAVHGSVEAGEPGEGGIVDPYEGDPRTIYMEAVEPAGLIVAHARVPDSEITPRVKEVNPGSADFENAAKESPVLKAARKSQDSLRNEATNRRAKRVTEKAAGDRAKGAYRDNTGKATEGLQRTDDGTLVTQEGVPTAENQATAGVDEKVERVSPTKTSDKKDK